MFKILHFQNKILTLLVVETTTIVELIQMPVITITYFILHSEIFTKHHSCLLVFQDNLEKLINMDPLQMSNLTQDVYRIWSSMLEVLLETNDCWRLLPYFSVLLKVF